MIPPSPHEHDTLAARVEQLEAENQRLREIISDKCDAEAKLARAAIEARSEIQRFRQLLGVAL